VGGPAKKKGGNPTNPPPPKKRRKVGARSTKKRGLYRGREDGSGKSQEILTHKERRRGTKGKNHEPNQKRGKREILVTAVAFGGGKQLKKCKRGQRTRLGGGMLGRGNGMATQSKKYDAASQVWADLEPTEVGGCGYFIDLRLQTGKKASPSGGGKRKN